MGRAGEWLIISARKKVTACLAALAPGWSRASVPEAEQERVMTREPHYDNEQVARRGTEMYQRFVKPQLRPEDKGRLVALDVDTGAFEVAETMHVACRR